MEKNVFLIFCTCAMLRNAYDVLGKIIWKNNDFEIHKYILFFRMRYWKFINGKKIKELKDDHP